MPCSWSLHLEAQLLEPDLASFRSMIDLRPDVASKILGTYAVQSLLHPKCFGDATALWGPLAWAAIFDCGRGAVTIRGAAVRSVRRLVVVVALGELARTPLMCLQLASAASSFCFWLCCRLPRGQIADETD